MSMLLLAALSKFLYSIIYIYTSDRMTEEGRNITTRREMQRAEDRK